MDIQSQVKDDLKKLDIIYAWSPIIMALPVMEFQDQGYKIRKIFAWKSTYPKEKLLNFENWTNGDPQNVKKSEF